MVLIFFAMSSCRNTFTILATGVFQKIFAKIMQTQFLIKLLHLFFFVFLLILWNLTCFFVPWVVFYYLLPQSGAVYMSVYLSSGDTLVSQHRLDEAQVCTAFEQMRGK